MEFFLVSTFHFLRVIMVNRRYVYINISVWNLYFGNMRVSNIVS